MNDLLTDPNFGKLPPQALDLEIAVLGAVLIEKDAAIQVMSILKAESFYKEVNQRIYACCVELSGRSEPIDILTVTNLLKEKGELELVGGPYYIAQLTNQVASAANIEFHARIVVQKHILRELIRISSQAANQAYDETVDTFALVDQLTQDVMGLTGLISGGKGKTTGELVDIVLDQSEKAGTVAGMTGVPTGFSQLDTIFGGWQPTDLIVIAARPAMGKTTIVLNSLSHAVSQGYRGLFISIEMGDVQLTRRRMSMLTGVPYSKIQKGDIRDYTAFREQLQSMRRDDGFYIEEVNELTQIIALGNKYKMSKDIQWMGMDYLQLASAFAKGGNREQEIALISRTCKALAKALDLPFLLISQLSRSVETRGGDRRPMLYDLRESGAIEQDADIVIFLHRPEYYGLTEDSEGNSTLGIANVIIAKHRNGAVGDVPLRFNPMTMKFKDYIANDPQEDSEQDLKAMFPNTDWDNEISNENSPLN